MQEASRVARGGSAFGVMRSEHATGCRTLLRSNSCGIRMHVPLIGPRPPESAAL